MTFANRSANDRGRAFGWAGLRVFALGLRFFTGRTSTSVPSAIAFGSLKSTLPFLTLPRTVMLGPSLAAAGILCWRDDVEQRRNAQREAPRSSMIWAPCGF